MTEPLPLSYAEKPIFDKGIQGARLIIKEASQAGRFVGQFLPARRGHHSARW
jgi:hypothetical protein